MRFYRWSLSHDDWAESSRVATVVLFIYICVCCFGLNWVVWKMPTDVFSKRATTAGTVVGIGAWGGFCWHRLKAQALEARRRSGRCLSCGYDLRATPNRCPECGGSVPDECRN
jgi:hypothetical protein